MYINTYGGAGGFVKWQKRCILVGEMRPVCVSRIKRRLGFTHCKRSEATFKDIRRM